MKKYEDAIQVLTQAVKLAPGKVEILNNLGNAYYNDGKYKEAGLQWAKVLELEPLNKTAKDNIKTLQQMGE